MRDWSVGHGEEQLSPAVSSVLMINQLYIDIRTGSCNIITVEATAHKILSMSP